jgi:kinetochore protein Spc25, fungi type
MSRVSRTPHLNLAAVLAQQNPRVDLKLEQHEKATHKFLRAVDDYANRAAAEIIRRRNEHSDETKRSEEKAKQIEAETTQCKVRELDLISGTRLCLHCCSSCRAHGA